MDARYLLSTVIAMALVHAATSAAQQQDPAWPGPDWPRVEPAEVGMDPSELARARDYALKGGGSGYITRNGKLVLAWGDPKARYDLKSTTKSFGSAAVGLAVADGRMALEDLVARHHPEIAKTAGAQPGWGERVTLVHLLTHTSGFDKPGGYSKLLFEPGTKWLYSDCGPNWLAECITLAYKRDVAELMFERVFAPLGIQPDDLVWRNNQYRPRTIDGIARREFGAGISANADAMARFGLLYLRGGRWQDRQIIPKEFVELSRAVPRANEDLPTIGTIGEADASNHYGLLWWTNGDATLKNVPADAYWSWGLGDSFIFVIPSLDVVVVRAGRAWPDLPGGHYAKVAPFLEPIVRAVKDRPMTPPNEPTAAPSNPKAPYPPSPVIRSMTWADRGAIRRQADDCDNWPITWADDDHQYTAYGDGRGFAPKVERKLSLGLCRIEGGPEDFRGFNVRSRTGEQVGDGARGKKASGMVCVAGTLYMFVRNAGNSQLAWSADHGATWTWADWKFTASFGCPTFLNFGRDYAGARDDYVYVYSFDSDSAYEPADRMVLARVPKDRIRDRAAYEFFVKRDREGPASSGPGGQGEPLWDRDIARRSPVFEHKGRCYRSGISYNAGLKRYLWYQVVPGGDTRFKGGMGVYDAPEPWGPWTTVYFTENWDVGPGECGSIPTKWMSEDGRTVHLVSSTDDYFSVRRATLELADQAAPAGGRTRVGLDGTRWTINGRPTFPGSPAEGLLMNVRMVNAVFEDANERTRPAAFDADANTRAFLDRLGDYADSGVVAFTLCLQGGMPGYEQAVNSAFAADGSLRAGYMARVERVIRAADERGLAVILGLFYQRQDQVLRDEAAIRAAVVNAADWVRRRGFSNVMLEIANEHTHGGFNHALLRAPKGMAELIALARRTAPGVLVSASGVGDGRISREVADASDFLLIHFNGTPVDQIPARVEALRKYGKPIVCNEDDKVGREGARAAEAAVAAGCSWGLMLSRQNQYVPFTFSGPADDPIIYATLKKLTAPTRPPQVRPSAP